MNSDPVSLPNNDSETDAEKSSASDDRIAAGSIVVATGIRELSVLGTGIVRRIENGQATVMWKRKRRIEQVPVAFLVPSLAMDKRLVEGPFDRATRYNLRTKGELLTSLSDLGLVSNARIDKLPHQLLAVLEFLQRPGPDRSMLLADEVGLGKTIEAGLTIKLLMDRGEYKRIMIVTPARLTRQWKAEMRHFGLTGFRILGRDFDYIDFIHEPLVIASLDTLKAGNSLASLKHISKPWDLVVVDEAHHLGRSQNGQTQRYRLMNNVVRDRTRDFLFLTATPHCGKPDRFLALLNLLQPQDFPFHTETITNRMEQGLPILTARQHEIASSLILLRRKQDVVHEDGSPAFFSRKTFRHTFSLNPEEQAFEEALDSYLANLGRPVEEQISGSGNVQARRYAAIVYRKLADSSPAAIMSALLKRHGRLKEKKESPTPNSGPDIAFFDGELQTLEEILKQIPIVDSKWNRFADAISSCLQETDQRKFLVFVEYLATQQYLAARLRELFAARFGEQCISIINGSIGAQERQEQEDRFRNDPNTIFLISTSAGSEGINLQSCSVLFNYDIPWNPMQLEQRIGRIHRYGRDTDIQVHNLFTDTSISCRIHEILTRKMAVIVQDLVAREKDSSDSVESIGRGIIGQLAPADWDGLFEAFMSDRHNPMQRAPEHVNRMLEKARLAYEAVGGGDALPGHLFTPDEYNTRIGFSGPDMVQKFVSCCLAEAQADLRGPEADGTYGIIRSTACNSTTTLPLLLPVDEAARFVFHGRLARDNPAIRVMGTGEPLFDRMLEATCSPAFGGEVSCLILDAQNIQQSFSGLILNYTARRTTGTALHSAALITVALTDRMDLRPDIALASRARYGTDVPHPFIWPIEQVREALEVGRKIAHGLATRSSNTTESTLEIELVTAAWVRCDSTLGTTASEQPQALVLHGRTR